MPDVPEEEFYRSGVLQGALERIRGQQSATMGSKRDFAKRVLNHLEDVGAIVSWEPAGAQNRYDYEVRLNSGRRAAIELKGCLDGNNTTIFERPPQANEFIIWSVCTNKGADPERNAWSGLHTRLSAEIIHRRVCVDGVVIWDMLCGTETRPCPKSEPNGGRVSIGQYSLPAPCIYLLPGTVPSPRNNSSPPPNELRAVEFLAALHATFGGLADDVQSVRFDVRQRGNEVERMTRVFKGAAEQRRSGWSPIRRA